MPATNPAPKGRQDKAWGVSPRLEATIIPSPEGAADGEEPAGNAKVVVGLVRESQRSAAAPAGLSGGWE